MSTYTNAFAQKKPERVPYIWQSIEAASSEAELDRLLILMPAVYKWEKDERLAYLNKARKASITISKNDSLIADIAQELALFYVDLDSIPKAISTGEATLKHCHSTEAKRIIYNALGFIYTTEGDQNQALTSFFKAVDEARKLSNGSETYSLGNISYVYANLHDYQNAIKYLKLSNQHAKKLEKNEQAYMLAYNYADIISWYLEMEKPDSVKLYIEPLLKNTKIIDTIQLSKFQDARYVVYITLAEFYLLNEAPEQAQHYIKKIRAFNQAHYNQQANILEAKYQILIDNHLAALKILEDEKFSESYSEELNKLKISCYEKLKRYKEAFQLQKDLTKYQKERFGEDKIKFSAFADAKYEDLLKNEEIKTLKRDKEIDSLTIQNQKYIVFLTLLLVCLSLFGAFAYWWRFRNRKKLSIYLQEQVDLKTKDLQKANEELRMLSYVASHDIKEPIRNISNFVGLIKRQIPEEKKEKLSFHFETIKNSTNQLYTLIEDITRYISMSKDSSIKTAPVNLDEVTNNVFFALETLANERKGKMINHELPVLESNPNILYVILKNLVENGLKFNTAEIPTVEVFYQEAPDHHQIIVKDNGLGIEKTYHNRIFEMFKRLHKRSEYDGSGIGLAIVKLMTEKLGGRVILNSQPGHGSTFTLQFPI